MNTPIHVDEDNLDDFSDCDSAYGDAEVCSCRVVLCYR